MEESAPVSSEPSAERYLALIRRHAHDVRNGLNGFEIETSLLEVIHSDGRTLDCVRRMRHQAGCIELALRFLLNRFAKPHVEVVPAIDVFNLWKSRSKRLAHFDAVAWAPEIGDALVAVDSSMVADLLCEGISHAGGAAIEAGVVPDGAEVLFCIRQRSESSGASLAAVDEWPLMDPVVGQNGGRYEVVTEPDGAVSRKYWFPAAALPSD